MQESPVEFLFGTFMAVLLLSVGVYLTVKLRLVQLRRFIPALRSMQSSKEAGVSAFSAACTNLGATVGMGNVLGVAYGISVGGPGCLLWMLVAAFFGMAIRYAENLLGARTKQCSGEICFGGPSVYIAKYLPRGGRPFGAAFALICLLGSLFGMGTALQVSSIRTIWSDWIGDDSFRILFLALLLLLVLAPVLIGGSVRIAKCAERIVPFMTIGYLICCAWILVRYAAEIPSVLREILRSGLSFRAAAGASVGLFLRRTVLTGIRRGLFSNEAGLGLGAIAAASAADSVPETAGDAGILVTFLDTFVICFLTGLCLLVTQKMNPADAWKAGLPWAGNSAQCLLSVFLTLFALTSVFGAGFYGESCLRSLSGGVRYLKPYRVACLICAGVGLLIPAEPLWRSADLINAALAVLNLTALFYAVKRRALSAI